MGTEIVERIRLFLIESPIKMTRLQGVGNVKGTVKRVLLELTASDGTVGWGEAAPWEVFTGTPEAAFAAVDVYLRPVLIGPADTPHPRDDGPARQDSGWSCRSQGRD
jgi:muconate cycloisomerase